MQKLTVRRRSAPGPVSVLELVGSVDRDTVHIVDREVAALVAQGATRILVSCAALSYLSSAGIGVFMSHLIRLNKSGGDMKFCGLSKHVRTVLDVGGFTKVLDVCDTEEDALARFRKDGTAKSARHKAVPEAQSLRIDRKTHGADRMTLRLAGDIDRHTIHALERALAECLEQGRAKIVVSCEGVTFLSSNGIGVFIPYVQKARAQGGDIRFCEMRDNALTVMTMLGMQHIFKVLQTEEEALASYGA